MDTPDTRPDNWGPVLDKLLLGLTHDISNRVATLAGVSDILSGDPTIPPILRALADEVPRLEHCIRLLRLLAVPDGERDEALETVRIVDDAIALAELHPDNRNIRFELASRQAVPPVIAQPTFLTHELVVALAAAAAEFSQADGTPSIAISCTAGHRNLVIQAGRFSVSAPLLAAARSDGNE